jgi:Uma2 family endonuclease
MAEVGIFGTAERVELLDGVVFDRYPSTPAESGVVNRLFNVLLMPRNSEWLTSVRAPVHLGPKSEPVPDIALLKPRSDFYSTSHPVAPDVLLLVEVADSSLERDREDKLPIYARAGIHEVWIVNLPQQQIEIYREPNAAGYTNVCIASDGDIVSPMEIPAISFPVARLMKS